MKSMNTDVAVDFTESTEKTLAELAHKLISNDLLAGRLEPSMRLRLNELKLRYGLGLSPLREALLRLASEGLVVAEGQRGFAVAPVSLAELADLTRTRQQIEAIALSEAISRGDSDWEANILSAFHRLSRAPLPSSADDTDTAINWELKHRAFHDALVAACDSPWLLRFHSQLVDHSERYRRARLFNPPGSAAHLTRDTNAEHREIMDAVLGRDASKACKLMREHLQRTADAAGGGGLS
jgi:DNA-binding GntR family transcriptional regulator